MKGLAIVWVMFIAIAMSMLGILFIVNSFPLLPSLLMLGSSGALFAVGVMLTKGGYKW